MGPRVRLWARRARAVALLQLVALLPLLLSFLPAVGRTSVSLYVPVGRFERRVEMANHEWRKTFTVEVVVLIEGPDARDLSDRMKLLMPRVTDRLRDEVTRLEPAEMATPRGREVLKAEMLRAVVAMLGSDLAEPARGQVREILFERYQLD